MPRKITAEMLYFNHRKLVPCREGMAEFERLFGNEVEVTEELCRQHALLFRPWGAIAYMLLPNDMYQEWLRQWNHYPTMQPEQDPSEFFKQLDTYIINGAGAFAQMFNQQEPSWNISASTINARRLCL